MIQADLGASGVPYTLATADGEEFRDFHNLRVAYTSAVIRTGTDLKMAMTLARYAARN